MIMACRMESTWVLFAAAVVTAALICLPRSAAVSVEEGECSAGGVGDCHAEVSGLHTGTSTLYCMIYSII